MAASAPTEHGHSRSPNTLPAGGAKPANSRRGGIDLGMTDARGASYLRGVPPSTAQLDTERR
jgi:hypothetical protein